MADRRATTRPHRSFFTRRTPQAAQAESRARRAAVIVNPTKVGVDDTRTRLTIMSQRLGWADPLILETTEDDPGEGQVAEALEAGVDLICPLGGDGTVRAVATGLAGTSTPMGLLPGGTGNLLARNLGLPIDSVDDAFEVACTGRNKKIDILRITADHGAPEVGLVMAGVGFDATVMADTNENLKGAIGWPAYIVSGMKHVIGHRFNVRISMTGSLPRPKRVRSVIIGNCGELQGGIPFLPDAQVDDGILDVAVLSPRTTFEWVKVIGAVLTRSTERRLERFTGAVCTIDLEEPHHFQIDGDAVGEVSHVEVEVDPASLIVRVPS